VKSLYPLTLLSFPSPSLKGQMPSKMTLENSFAVPFFSSAVLFGFWCLLKYFPDLDLKVVLKSYLFLVGSIAVGSNFSEPLSRWLKPLAAIKKSISESDLEQCSFLVCSLIVCSSGSW
jgi:hypothetical protein